MRNNEPTQSAFAPDLSAMDISNEQFDKMTEQTVKMVENLGLNAESMMPKLVVHHRHLVEGGMLSDISATLIAIADGFNDSNEKRQLLRNLGRKFYKDMEVPCAVFMASEAWTSVKIKENLNDGLMPSQDPDRKEVLIISGRTMEGECKVGVSIPVRRDDKNIMRRDGENAVFKNSNIEMALLNQFLIGFFEPIMKKFSKEQLEEMAKGSRR